MGLLTSLLIAPLAAPLKGVVWVVETLAGHAENELYNEDNIRKELAQLEQRYELHEIAIEEFEKIESELLERMNQARRMKEGW